MSNAYSLPRAKARICRIAGATFLVIAAATMSSILVSASLPEIVGTCAKLGCEVTGPASRLSTEDQAQVAASPAAQRRFDDYLATRLVRAGLAGVAVLETVPFAVLLMSVGLALRRFGGRAADPLARALPWLRRASIAAIAGALAGPFHDSLLVMLLYPGTPAGPHWMIVLDFQSMALALMLAVAAYATVWALEAGLRAQRELAEIV